MKNIFFTVSIVTMNREKELKRAIESVYKQTYKNFEIIVVDNNSTDNTVEMIENNYPDIKLIKLDKNIGCPPARNVSIKAAKGDVIFFLDDDAWLEPNALEELAKQYQLLDDKVMVIMLNYYEYYGNKRKKVYKTINHPIDIFNFIGAVTSIKKQAFDEIGLFADLIYGSEETRFSIKLFKKGYKLKLLPYVYAHHKPSFFRDKNMIYFSKVRNELATNIIFYPLIFLPIMLVWRSLSYTYHAHKEGYAKASLKGVWTAIKELPRDFKHREPLTVSEFISFMKQRRKSFKKYKIW